MMKLIISKNRNYIDLDLIIHYLREESYWGKDRDKETILRSIEKSECYSVLVDKKFIGFARVITDYSTFKYLCDVFILPAHQNQGIGSQLLDFITKDPEIGKGGWLLLTRDAHKFYKKFGFTKEQELKDKLMFRQKEF